MLIVFAFEKCCFANPIEHSGVNVEHVIANDNRVARKDEPTSDLKDVSTDADDQPIDEFIEGDEKYPKTIVQFNSMHLYFCKYFVNVS